MMMKGKGLCTVHQIAWVLVLVGALNWGLVGAFNFNLVSKLLGAWPMAEKIVYILVGVAALASAFAAKCCGGCDKCGMPSGDKPAGGMGGGMQK